MEGLTRDRHHGNKKKGRPLEADPFSYSWCRSRDLNPDGLWPLPPQDSVSTKFHHFGTSCPSIFYFAGAGACGTGAAGAAGIAGVGTCFSAAGLDERSITDAGLR